jgi:hypothetical protein
MRSDNLSNLNLDRFGWDFSSHPDVHTGYNPKRWNHPTGWMIIESSPDPSSTVHALLRKDGTIVDRVDFETEADLMKFAQRVPVGYVLIHHMEIGGWEALDMDDDQNLILYGTRQDVQVEVECLLGLGHENEDWAAAFYPYDPDFDQMRKLQCGRKNESDKRASRHDPGDPRWYSSSRR